MSVSFAWTACSPAVTLPLALETRKNSKLNLLTRLRRKSMEKQMLLNFEWFWMSSSMTFHSDWAPHQRAAASVSKCFGFVEAITQLLSIHWSVRNGSSCGLWPDSRKLALLKRTFGIFSAMSPSSLVILVKLTQRPHMPSLAFNRRAIKKASAKQLKWHLRPRSTSGCPLFPGLTARHFSCT